MPNHVTEWLNAYMDGELKGGQLQQVEAHLAGCDECRADLASLKNLSNLLHESPAPEFISSERFANQVSLRIPHEQTKSPESKALEVGWWMIPVSLMLLWVFIGTAMEVRAVVATVNDLGYLNSLPTWLVQGAPSGDYWAATLGGYGLLSGSSLKWAELTESFTKTTLPLIAWQASIGFMYLGWIAAWWVRHTRSESNNMLKA